VAWIIPRVGGFLLELWQDDALLTLVFALFVLVADFRWFVALEEENLAEAFVGVDTRGQRRRVGDFEGDETLPFRLERRDVHDDAATRVGGLADTNGEHVARNLEVLDGTREGKGVRRNDTDIGLDADKGALVEFFGIDNGAVHIREDLEFIGDPQIVAVAGKTVGDDAFAYLLLGEWVDHVVFVGHLADPTVGENGHRTPGELSVVGGQLSEKTINQSGFRESVILRNRVVE